MAHSKIKVLVPGKILRANTIFLFIKMGIKVPDIIKEEHLKQNRTHHAILYRNPCNTLPLC